MKPVLTIPVLIESAKEFCERESRLNHTELIGTTDGKAVGTYVEHRFQNNLQKRYTVEIGNSARGIDFPGAEIETDLKVTSAAQPQSSCPFKNARQKVYGLGYHLLVLVYEKHDTADSCHLRFTHCTFTEKSRTGDYTITRRLREMLEDDAGMEDIAAFLTDRNVPGDEITIQELSREILRHPPEQGYLTISNALQ